MAVAAAAADISRGHGWGPMPEENDHSERDARVDAAEYKRRYLVLIASIVVFVLGIIVTFVAGNEGVRFTGTPGKPGETIYTEQTNPLRSVVGELGPALVTLGAVGLVFDLFLRRAGEQATIAAASQAARAVGDDIAKQTALAVLGNPGFAREVMKPEKRQEYLEAFMLATLNDDEAQPLAQRTAAELAGGSVLRNFKAEYIAKDKPANAGDVPSACVRISMHANTKPSDHFRFRFELIDEDDDEDALKEDDPDVFIWRYWLDKAKETAEPVSALFGVSYIRVNGKPIDVSTPPDLSDDHKRKAYSFPASIADADSYQIEFGLDLPPPKQGAHAHFEPRRLARDVTFICDYALSEYDVVVIETLRTDDVTITRRPREAIPKTSVEVHSPDWVLPSASVAFVFYKDREQQQRGAAR